MKFIIDKVSKKYKNRSYINLSYTFDEGKCYMIVGANGSGKSTLLRGMMGLLHFTNGKIINEGFTIGYVPEKMIFPLYLTVYNFIKYICEIKKPKNVLLIEDYLEMWKLTDKRNFKLKNLSKGMLQKILIIQALIIEPKMYIFDEVLNGLDIKMQEYLLQIIEKEKNKGKTVVITSHYPKIYEEVVDEVIILE